ncbi:type II restriction endonuclease [Clostridium bornimense]|uniref:Type II restriction endonuclease n=1 Tax=Clostridium bornimense TaxID=1216932 RepID=W6RTS7_9CLOT|nr:Sau3AI family type II restriction endonuclease [Clostridium bornimense]CDM68006.1 type II restriction endonuclease [Clostridium bornimense]
MYLPYNETDAKSIENYAQNLIGKSFSEILGEYNNNLNRIYEDTSNYGSTHENKKRKGGLGELIEECFFQYKCNNDSNPDFDKAGVELKVTPYKINKNKSLSAKERLILTMIDYCEVINEDFYESHLWKKSNLILLVYYLYSKEIPNRLDYRINYAKLFTPPKQDLEIIKNDYNIIVNKIRNGKAHELSEGDTMYLGAATKAATSANSRKQPFSDIPAKPRAFSFKVSYMTHILNTYIVPNKTTYEPIIKNVDELKNKTFEEYIINKINIHIGKSDKELCELFNREYNNNKSQWCDLSYRMLGIKSNKAEEFIKANVVVKAIRIENNNSIKESMSFPAFKFKDIINEEWEESSLFNYFDKTKFLFVVFKKNNDIYELKGCQFWNMPYNDLNTIVFDGWNKVRETIINGVILTIKETKSKKIVLNNFPKKEDNPIVHIRPHTQRSAYLFNDGVIIGDIHKDANELPDGRYMTTQSFWINNTYILSQLNKSLLK